MPHSDQLAQIRL